ncbi:MAG TPA: hypothetical protein PKC21_02985 [Oligoflexia bacterium]|nr:hypothetical protein [Oligoflexia bacterium]HMR24298.1 hypothetical protein [Oligoflexia bacterium]
MLFNLGENLIRNICVFCLLFFVQTRAQDLFPRKDKARENIGRFFTNVDERTVWDIYRENIYYQSLDEVDFSKLNINGPNPIPRDLAHNLKSYPLRDSQKLISQLKQGLESLGLDEQDVPNMSAKEAIENSIKLSDSLLEMYPNNFDPEDEAQLALFLSKGLDEIDYYTRSIEEKVENGKGDCDDFTNLTLAAFRWFKSLNPQLSNIYVSDQECGGTMVGHAYNGFIFLFQDSIVVSFLDAWLLNKGESMYGARGTGEHVSDDDFQFKLDFYTSLNSTHGKHYFLKQKLANTQNQNIRKEVLIQLIEIAGYRERSEELINLINLFNQEEMNKLEHLKEKEINVYHKWRYLIDLEPVISKNLAAQYIENFPENKFEIAYIYEIYPELKSDQ